MRSAIAEGTGGAAGGRDVAGVRGAGRESGAADVVAPRRARPSPGVAAALLLAAILPASACAAPIPPGAGEAREGGATIAYLVRGTGPALVVLAGPREGEASGGVPFRVPRLERLATVVYADGIDAAGASSGERLDALRRHLGLERMALLGHGAGAGAALRYGLAGQGRLTKLILSGAVPEPGVLERLASLRVPTLILAGRHDDLSPPESALALRERIPRSRLTIFESSGRAPHLDEEESYALTVGAFLLTD